MIRGGCVVALEYELEQVIHILWHFPWFLIKPLKPWEKIRTWNLRCRALGAVEDHLKTYQRVERRIIAGATDTAVF